MVKIQTTSMIIGVLFFLSLVIQLVSTEFCTCLGQEGAEGVGEWVLEGGQAQRCYQYESGEFFPDCSTDDGDDAHCCHCCCGEGSGSLRYGASFTQADIANGCKDSTSITMILEAVGGD